jgi:glyoxylase-like metal-dependent hydrolase (beta-lactamase superfamily II)
MFADAEHIKSDMADDYWTARNVEEWVGTELIPNNSDTVKMSIHRYYGIPKFGIPTDKSDNILDTVWYTKNNCVKFDGQLLFCNHTDTSVTVFWKETKFRVLVVNMLTGDTVFQEVHQGRPALMLEKFSSFFAIYDSKIDDNAGISVNYPKLSQGSYFVFVMDVNSNTVAEVRNLRNS